MSEGTRSKTREQAMQETREALLRAGMVEFADRGLDAPSLDAICARAGYTRGAFYVHFRDREDLLVAVMERVIAAWLAAVEVSSDEAHDLERSIDRFAGMFGAVQAGGLPTAEALAALPGDAPFLAVGATRFHLVLQACQRSPVVRQRFAALIGDGMARVGGLAAAGQAAGTLRGDVDPKAAGTLLVTLVLGLLSAAEAGVPIDGDALRVAVQAVSRPGWRR